MNCCRSSNSTGLWAAVGNSRSDAWYAARTVRIIKRGRDEGQQSLPPGRDEKTTRQSEREIAGTVKG